MTDHWIVLAGLMPHAPVLVPGVGGRHLAQVAATAAAMRKLAARVVAAKPETLILISPHSPRRAGAIGLWHTPQLRGSLARFGSPEDEVELPRDREFEDRLMEMAKTRHLPLWEIKDESLDHGAVVPLCFLSEAGWCGSTVILGLGHPSEIGRTELGQALAATAAALRRRTVVIASGDMSHRLTATAPSGFHPDARKFDDQVIALLRAGTAESLAQIDPALQEVAGEDVIDSTLIALAAVGHRMDRHEVLSYEGPFGVGYGVAVLFDATEQPAERPSENPTAPKMLRHFSELPLVARCAVEAQFSGGPPQPPFVAKDQLTEAHGLFVTIRTSQGELRGCIGTLCMREADLVRETWHYAVAAALQDRRFAPVTATELPQLRFTVTVLEPLEAVGSPDELDASVYGVVVSAEDGRKGVLLPAIPGVGSVAAQLTIAREKGGIAPEEPVKLQRFRAQCYCETNLGTHAPASAQV